MLKESFYLSVVLAPEHQVQLGGVLDNQVFSWYFKLSLKLRALLHSILCLRSVFVILPTLFDLPMLS